MAFLRSMLTPKTAAIASAAAFVSSLPSSSSSHSSSQFPGFLSKTLNSGSIPLSWKDNLGPFRLGVVKSLAASKMEPPSSNHKPSSSIQNGAFLPELLTEYMVDMSCEGCVEAVKNKLQTVAGVKNVEVDLTNQVVRVLGTSPVKTMTDALEQTGRKARLIGQGSPDDYLVSAAVSEFKGPLVFGIVRFAQVNMELARIEANFNGLSPGKHGWSINEFGDLTGGAASTGKVYNPANSADKEPLGDLGTLEFDEKGDAFFSGGKQNLRVLDLIGRSVVVYETEDKSDPGLVAAVIARSAGVGENYKKLCTCDGTTIWEA
ncbi:copper chaperone for superoxide dismutase, chloroplastic [Coffea arabica]|uniref:Superoxide dismutase copper chaperone n=1 Tax=Coffea arabica TaxID=13443 RepID=A0A6P6TM44_COFAR|nr:copper chaperone for superoxide dismutase, chloroplastic-like [Coffea arabica]